MNIPYEYLGYVWIYGFVAVATLMVVIDTWIESLR